MNWKEGDRVQEIDSGWVGTVCRVYLLDGVELVAVDWDGSVYRSDDPAIGPFDPATEKEIIARRRQVEP